jgi:hypothetical protein
MDDIDLYTETRRVIPISLEYAICNQIADLISILVQEASSAFSRT